MIRRMGRPGLVGTMARTAVVAGTATAVCGGLVRHAQTKEMAAQHVRRRDGFRGRGRWRS